YGKNPLLGADVILKAAVAIQVVGRDVEDDGDRGMELNRAFELEAGDFKNRPGFVGAGIDERNNRDADVAANQRGDAGRLKNLAQQGGGGGLAVGAGDGQGLALEEAGSQFQLANHLQAES